MMQRHTRFPTRLAVRSAIRGSLTLLMLVASVASAQDRRPVSFEIQFSLPSGVEVVGRDGNALPSTWTPNGGATIEVALRPAVGEETWQELPIQDSIDPASDIRAITHRYSVHSGRLQRDTTLYTFEDGELEEVEGSRPPTRGPRVFRSPLVWVALAVVLNLFLAVVVLWMIRKRPGRAA